MQKILQINEILFEQRTIQTKMTLNFTLISSTCFSESKGPQICEQVMKKVGVAITHRVGMA